MSSRMILRSVMLIIPAMVALMFAPPSQAIPQNVQAVQAADPYDVPFQPQNLSGRSSPFIQKVQAAQDSFTCKVRVRFGRLQSGWRTDNWNVIFKMRSGGPVKAVKFGRTVYWRVPKARGANQVTFYYSAQAFAKRVGGKRHHYSVSRNLTIYC